MYALWIIFVFLFLYMAIVIKGPSIWDRLLGMNLISIKIIVIIVLFASFSEAAILLDFAIIFALSGFVGTIFIALFFQERTTGEKKRWK